MPRLREVYPTRSANPTASSRRSPGAGRRPAAGRRWRRGAGARRSPASRCICGSRAPRGLHGLAERRRPSLAPRGPARVSTSASMSVCQSASRDSDWPIARAIDASVSGPTNPESISVRRTPARATSASVNAGSSSAASGKPSARQSRWVRSGRHAGQLGDLQPGVAARPVEQQALERLAGVRARGLPRIGHAAPWRAVSRWCARRGRRTAERRVASAGTEPSSRPLMPASPRLPTTSRSAFSRRTTSSSVSTGEPCTASGLHVLRTGRLRPVRPRCARCPPRGASRRPGRRRPAARPGRAASSRSSASVGR